MASREALSDTVHQFWRALDLGEYDEVVSLVAEDCSWQREALVAGRSAILQALMARPANLLTRHQVSNLRVTDGDAPAAHFMITTFGTLTNGNDGSLPDCGSPALVADVEMHFAAVGGEHLIAEIRTRIVFRKPQS